MEINFFSQNILRTPKKSFEFIKDVFKLNSEGLIEFALRNEYQHMKEIIFYGILMGEMAFPNI